MTTALNQIDRHAFYEQMNEKGYGLLKDILNPEDCERLKRQYPQDELYRKTVVMERHQYGKGRYRYYQHPLPDELQQMREALYPLLAPLANQWSKALNLGVYYPENYSEFLEQCAAAGQKLATPLILQYPQGGYNTLHQDLYGEVYFPMQAIICLSEPGSDFTGGNLVLTEQRPRAQSRAIVINPGLGDMVVIPTQFRPQKGARGYYRLNMRHGVSEILTGQRYSMGIILHNALK